MKEVSTPLITERLIDRFSLRDFVPQKFMLIEQIQPVTNIDELLKIPKIYSFPEVAITSTGPKTLLTVPNDKRYHIKAIRVDNTSGTFTFNQLLLRSALEDTDTVNIKDFGTPTINPRYYPIDGPFTLEAGMRLVANCDSKTTNGAVIARVLFEEEDAY